MGKPLVIRTKFCEVCNKPLRCDAVVLLCRPHGVSTRNRNYWLLNKEYLNKASAKYRSENLSAIQEYDRIRAKNPDRKLAHKISERKKLKLDPNYRIAKYMRNTVYVALKRNSNHPKAVEFLGCTISEYKKYIEDKFSEGMTWDNYGEWHIDHIQPLFSFNLKDREQFLTAAHFANTQPLWAKDNLIKRNIELRGTP